MKIIVLAGGISTERDVSLSSGAEICRALLEKGHDVFLLDVYLGLPDLTTPPEKVFTQPGHGLEIAQSVSAVEPDIEKVKASRDSSHHGFFGPNVIDLCRIADITFLGLHGGEGENGQIQATFELFDITYTGSDSLGCALAMDKDVSRQLFAQAGIPIPKGITLTKQDLVATHGSAATLGICDFSFPLIIKPCSGGSSIGVFIVHTKAEYDTALEKVFSYEDEIIVEEYIVGREFSCAVLDGQTLPPIEIIPNTGFFDYANKYQPGATVEVCPADIPESLSQQMQALTLKAFNLLKLSVYGRADFMMDSKGQLYCLEINTLPGMTPASLFPQEAAAIGLSYPDLCQIIVDASLALRDKR